LANRADPQRLAGELLVAVTIIVVFLARRLSRWVVQELPALSKFVLSVAIGEKAVIADPLEPFGQNVKQEAADELLGRELHGFVLVVVAVVPPAEPNVAVLEVEQAVVGDGDAMRVLRNIAENLFRPGKRCFGVHYPFGFAEGSEVTQEGPFHLERLEGGEELELSGIEGLFAIGQEQATEQARQDANRQKEIRPAGNPTRPVERKATAGDNEVQVRMMAPTPTIP
jgi:hypothetical protein